MQNIKMSSPNEYSPEKGNVKKTLCLICGKHFQGKDSLNNHMISIHEVQPMEIEMNVDKIPTTQGNTSEEVVPQKVCKTKKIILNAWI